MRDSQTDKVREIERERERKREREGGSVRLTSQRSKGTFVVAEKAGN